MRSNWPMVALLSLAATVAYMDRLILSVLFVPLARDLLLDDTQMSLLQGGSFAVIYAFAGLPLGLLADRANRRAIIIAGVTVWCGATIACGLAQNFTALLLLRAVVGVGEAALIPAATSLIGDSVALHRRGLALGIFIMGQILGGGAAVAVGGVLLDQAQQGAFAALPMIGALAPWRIVLVLVGLPGVPLLLGLALLREPARQERADARMHKVGDVIAQFAARRSRILPLYLVLACAAIADFSVGAWTPSLLLRKFGWSGTATGLWFGLCLILSGVIASLLAGLLSDWARRRQGNVLGWALASALVALLCSFFAVIPDAPLLLAILFVQSLASSICSLLCLIAIQVSLPNELRGIGSALSSLGNILLGLGCGPTLVALATDHLYRDPGAVGWSIVTVAVPAFLLCTLLLLRVRRPYAAIGEAAK